MHYEVLWCECHTDIRDLPDSIGFAMPFLVGTPGEKKILGVFPNEMGCGYARQMERAMTALGISPAISFHVTKFWEIPVVHDGPITVLHRHGRPVGLALGKVWADGNQLMTHNVEIGRIYYEGIESS